MVKVMDVVDDDGTISVTRIQARLGVEPEAIFSSRLLDN
jgi:hypothetical protein